MQYIRFKYASYVTYYKRPNKEQRNILLSPSAPVNQERAIKITFITLSAVNTEIKTAFQSLNNWIFNAVMV